VAGQDGAYHRRFPRWHLLQSDRAHSGRAAVQDLVKQAQKSKSKTQNLADTAALWLTLIALVSGAGTFLVWLPFMDRELAFAIERAVTVIIVQLSRATFAKMIQNLFWAIGYNVVAIALAAGALYAWGAVLSPALGAALMAASTVIVAVNARLLKLKE